MKNIFKYPWFNSFIAEVYIICVTSVIHWFARPNTPDTFLDPVAAMSLFVLSAAIMGYLFLGEPLKLYLDGEKKRAVSFFGQTVLGFATITFTVVLLVKIFG